MNESIRDSSSDIGASGGMMKLYPEHSSAGVVKGVLAAEKWDSSSDMSSEVLLEGDELAELEFWHPGCE
jgi:hypothetical protein